MVDFSLTLLNCWEWVGLRKVGWKHLRHLRHYWRPQLQKKNILALTELSWLGAVWLWRQRLPMVYRPSSVVGNALIMPNGKIVERASGYFKAQHFEMRNWVKLTVDFSGLRVVFWHTHLERGERPKPAEVRRAQLLELLRRIEAEKTSNQIVSGDFNFHLGGDDVFNQEIAKSGFKFFGEGVDLVGIRGDLKVKKVWQETPLYLFKKGRWEVQERGAPTDHSTGALHLDLAASP